MRAGQALDQLADGANLVWVQADGGFVQDDQFRLMDQGVGQADALAEAFGELADDAAADFGQPALFHDGVDAAAGVCSGPAP